MVLHHYGENTWSNIKQNSGVENDFFVSSEPYDDEITYKLAVAIADETQKPVGDILQDLGNWWILKTASVKYGYLLSSGGTSLSEFLMSLPVFHNRVMMLYPKLTPPEFKTTLISEKELHLEYISRRKGLTNFLIGLIGGLSELYNTPVEIVMLSENDAPGTHQVFKITWN